MEGRAMKRVNSLIFLFLLLVGLSGLANANGCYKVVNIPVCEVHKIYETYTKKIPYTVWKKVCVPVKDSCNRTRYVSKSVCETRYKFVTKRKFKGYEHIGYYNGREVRLFWPTRRSTIPIQIPTDCCSANIAPSCNSCQ